MSISKVCPHKFVIGFHMRIKFIVLWKTIFIIQYASVSCFALKYGIALCRNPSGESSQNKFIKVLNSLNLIFFRRSSIYCLHKTLNDFPRVLFNHNNVGHYLVCKKTFRPSEIMLKPGSPSFSPYAFLRSSAEFFFRSVLFECGTAGSMD